MSVCRSPLLPTLIGLFSLAILGRPGWALAQDGDSPALNHGPGLPGLLASNASIDDDDDDAPLSIPVEHKAPPRRPVKAPPRPRAKAKPSQQRIEGDDTEAPAPASVRHVAPERGEGEAREPSAAPPPGMDFDLLPEKSAAGPDALALESKVNLRRGMLQYHQIFGIATAVLMIGTVVTGQLNYSDRFGGGSSGGQFEIWHSGLEAATVLSFATTGLLALFAPVPFEKKSEGIDTVTVHKWSMLVATIGMASEIPLGIYTVSREGYVNQGTMALAHLIIGYITAAALTAGAAAIFF